MIIGQTWPKIYYHPMEVSMRTLSMGCHRELYSISMPIFHQNNRQQQWEKSNAITFTFSCQKQSSGGFLLNGNHIAFFLSPRSTLFLLHTHTHMHIPTYNCCSQGNMKGPGRYRDILGPSSISHGQEL